APSPSPRPPPVHRSLRTKKKSLELPDLASLTLTPAHSPNASPHGPYRRPKASSPIPIPIPTSPQNPLSKEHSYHSFGPQRPPHLQSATQISLNVAVPDVVGPCYPAPTSATTPPVPFPPAINPPPSKKSTTIPTSPFAPKPSTPPSRSVSASLRPRLRASPAKPKVTTPVNPYLPRSHGMAAASPSTLPAQATPIGRAAHPWIATPTPTPSRLGCPFSLARTISNSSSMTNGASRTDLPTAVDDDGSLANYVNVPMSGFTPPSPTHDLASSAPPTPALPLSLGHADKAPGGHQISFWSDSSTPGASSNEPAQWTTVLPVELLAAAQAEEAYLALTAGRDDGSIPAPNIPPAPILPRHLDKLILNVRPGPTPASREGARERERETGRRSSEREKDRERERNAANQNGRVRSRTRHASAGQGGKETKEVTGKPLAQLSGPALADDASVLPVPSHVVLHHLSTSAIRNGVLAVGNTTRYKKKLWGRVATVLALGRRKPPLRSDAHVRCNSIPTLCVSPLLADYSTYADVSPTVHNDHILQANMTRRPTAM
ncbi:hypothetical protein EVG20_g4653, partial [Dentipellis fragilis]